MVGSLTSRRIGALGLVLLALLGADAASSRGDLASRVSAGQHRAGQLQSGIQADTARIHGYEGTISMLQPRLSAIERSVAIQERQLSRVQDELDAVRVRLSSLRAQYARDRRVLAAELLADYESPPPTLVGVIVDAHGFDDLLNRLNRLRAIERQNAGITKLVSTQRIAVAAEARRLGRVQAQRRRATAAVLVERDQIVQLRLSIVARKLATASSRARKTAELTALRRTLTRESAVLEARAAAAAAAAGSGGSAVAPAGCVNTPFVPHGGEYGFFPAAGTNYSVGEEPIIAARLDALGRSLGLHLIGVSGYRSPQHSVEVGGFANDPHTQGLASDTPGVEGVAEATLARFCLTRPFPGAREADHIQEL